MFVGRMPGVHQRPSLRGRHSSLAAVAHVKYTVVRYGDLSEVPVAAPCNITRIDNRMIVCNVTLAAGPLNLWNRNSADDVGFEKNDLTYYGIQQAAK